MAGEPDPEPSPEGRIGPTGVGPLVCLAVLGLVAGWAIRWVALRLGYAEPAVPLVSVALLFFGAAILGATAWLTRRAVRSRRTSLLPHQAVNRLVLAKACALAGALVGGGYLGYALAQLGIGEPAAQARLWRSALAGLGGLGVMATALFLEHACRVPKDPRRDP